MKPLPIAGIVLGCCDNRVCLLCAAEGEEKGTEGAGDEEGS